MEKEQFGYTRLRTFQLCPKKHSYIYKEGIEAKNSINVELGRLFHQCLEGFYDCNQDLIDEALDSYKKIVRAGDTDLDADLLEYVFTKYTQYYADSDAYEDTIAVEAKFVDDINEEDEFCLVVDRVVYNKKTGMMILRDTKTTLNKLKYKHEDVLYNTQLLTYIPFIENELHIKIDMIEIDEVRLCKLQPTPLNANGKPTGDKSRLEFTTFEMYMDTLMSMGLDTDKAYFGAIQYMEKRGHPMFNRVSAQVLDPLTVQTNLNDMFDTYNAIKAGAEFRNRGPLCSYCDYKGLCDFDRYSTSSSLREIEINKIMGSKTE